MSELNRATITAKEAADYIGISYWLILDLAKKRKINCIRAGARVLFRKETLDIWMHNQEIQSVSREDEIGKIRKVEA